MGFGSDKLLRYTALGREAERAEREAEMDDARRKDLDETRRLAYMALLVNRTKKYELAASLVNALVHHQQVDDRPELVIGRILDVLGEPGPEQEEAEDWLRAQITRVTGVLDAEG
jgi:hypothetical protein